MMFFAIFLGTLIRTTALQRQLLSFTHQCGTIGNLGEFARKLVAEENKAEQELAK